MKPSILIVDDEKDTRDFMARALADDYTVSTAPDAEVALSILAADPSIVLLLTDVRMPGMSGIDLLKTAKQRYPRLACILLTAYGTISQAVDAIKDGAIDFIPKPIDLDDLEKHVANALKTVVLEDEVARLRSQLDEKYGLENIIGTSEAMKRVFRVVRQAAPTTATVLIQGPSGTGKELIAHALHNLSPRAHGPFVAVQCGALPETLLESELFGHEKGAYTGAVQRQIGRFEAADKGTIFLDEISEITPATQVKLLRALETRTITRLGSTESIHTDIRVIAATNRDLAAYVAEGKFREDLYYRLAVVDVTLPPLKARTGDVPLLVSRFLKDFSEANGGRITGITPEALKILESWNWPGNVRELRNTIEKMVVLAQGTVLDVEDVPERLREQLVVPALTPDSTLEETKKAKILATLKQAKGNRSLAAKMLGISRRTLYRQLSEYNITEEDV